MSYDNTIQEQATIHNQEANEEQNQNIAVQDGSGSNQMFSPKSNKTNSTRGRAKSHHGA